MTWEHLRPLLERPRDTHLLFRAGELLCQGHVPLEVLNIILLGRLTALQKPTGRVRGIVAGEVLRRLVARTMAQQLGPAVGNFTAPFQFALTTRSGCECVAHTIQALCQADPELTLTSLDGVSAFDLISRRAMLEGLAHVPGGASALPFVHLFYGRPSRYLWEDDHGVAHAIEEGEGGEQADADFGQTDFGHPFWPTLAKPTLAQIGVSIFWGLRRVGPPKGGAAEGWGVEGWGVEGWGPEGWGGQNFALFLPFSIAVSLSLCLCGCLLVEFWWCLKRRSPQMCTFGVLGLLCEAPAAPKHSWPGLSQWLPHLLWVWFKALRTLVSSPCSQMLLVSARSGRSGRSKLKR